jgi:glyoxylase-like metal-dependent hydrolase (beta-lactamase superfamily II)
MHRRSFLRHSAFTLGALTLGQQKLLAAILPQTGNIKMLRKNVGIYTERGGTIGFLLSDEGIVTIDSQFPDTATKYIAEVQKLNTKPLTYLLNTHHHGDHTGGNIAFKGIVEHVAAHKNSIENQRRVAERQNTLDKQLLPDVSFDKEFKVKIANEKIKGDYFGAGHTNGDTIYHFEEAGVVHMGDLMFNRRHPFIDKTAGASIANWIDILKKASTEYGNDTLYIFGHAAEGQEVTGSGGDLLKFRDYLQRLLDYARAEHKAGKSKEEFLKNTAIPGVTEWQGSGIERPLTAAWEEVTSQQ